MESSADRPEPIRTVLWQGLWYPGTEWCELAGRPDGWRLSGLALIADDGVPARLEYEIDLDPTWATRAVRVAALAPGQPERRLALARGEEGAWRIEWAPVLTPAHPADDPAPLHGLVDIDLGFSPATNTLPIRRLAPAIGEAADVTAVWVRFPELTIEPLPQCYTRLGERHYRYASHGGSFVADLEVDDVGLVVTYEGGWRRIAASSM
jgi:hypothetical protein